MSTLADILVNASGAALTSDQNVVGWREAACKLLSVSPVIVINDVAKYFFEVFWDRKEGLKESSFPNVAPPFQSFWMEYRVPGGVAGSESRQTVPMVFGGRRVGFFWYAEDLPDASSGWRLSSAMFVEEDGSAMGPIFSVCDDTDASGQLVKKKGMSLVPWDSDTPKEEVEFADNTMMLLHSPAELALCFMHCANVRILDHPPKENHRRRYQKLYGRPPIIYKTLNITPMQRIIASKGGAKCGLKQALHIMRGHFKRFDDKPLFGKHTGMWRWSSQMRGSLQQGYVWKTYDVHPPKKD